MWGRALHAAPWLLIRFVIKLNCAQMAKRVWVTHVKIYGYPLFGEGPNYRAVEQGQWYSDSPPRFLIEKNKKSKEIQKPCVKEVNSFNTSAASHKTHLMSIICAAGYLWKGDCDLTYPCSADSVLSLPPLAH